jgi:hypothetical protein
MFPVDAPGDDFIKRLKEDASVFKVFEETLHRRVDVKTVEPEREDTSFAFAFSVKVFDYGFLGFVEGVEARVSIEEIGDEGEIQFGISGDQGCGSEILSAIQFICIL